MIKLIGLSFAIGLTILMTFTFVYAYFTPEKTVILHINNYGEADLELLFIAVFFPFALYYFARSINEV